MDKMKEKRKNSQTFRVAVYTRKSTDEGLKSELSSLDAQRLAVETFVASRHGDGWLSLPEQYSDGGYSGKNTNRPGFQKLLRHIREGRVDCVGVYKIDRLSRSLIDFVQTMKVFEQHSVTFISVTQDFNTGTSMGALMLNILMSFAQFEREVIAERTRDQRAAARKKGLWTGGVPILGYDLKEKKLVVNKEEAKRVQAIFDLYLAHGSNISVAEEINRRGWKTKGWRRNGGGNVSGKAFDKDTVKRIVTNPCYMGKVRYGGEIFQGAHEGIVDEKTWNSVARLIKENGKRNGGTIRCTSDALLLGLVRCDVCGAAMTSHSSQKGNRKFPSYVCQTYQKRGARACPGSRVALSRLDAFIVKQVFETGKNPGLLRKTIERAKEELKRRKPELLKEKSEMEGREVELRSERRNILYAIAKNSVHSGSLFEKLSEIEAELDRVSGRIDDAGVEITALESQVIEEGDLKLVIETIDPIWHELFLKERRRILGLLMEEVTFNGQKGEIRITFRARGVRALVEEYRGKEAE